VGSSFLPSELSAAFLKVQLEASREVTARRLDIWRQYDEALGGGQLGDEVLTPAVPADCEHNAHIYHLRLASLEQRSAVLGRLRAEGIQPTSHYVPLHSAPAGRRYGRAVGPMSETDRAGDCLLRLPLWVGLTPDEVDQVIEVVRSAVRR
jgi:dTDP-4-amino-4,6-dideoxygalactose transaminase